jgi:hypothetical protein
MNRDATEKMHERKGLSTNAKLALAVELVALVAVGALLGLVFSGAGPVGMDHGPAGSDHEVGGAGQGPVAGQVRSAEREGGLLLVEAAGDRALREGTRSELERTEGVSRITGFLLVRQDDGSFVQGVEVRRGRALAFGDGRPIELSNVAALEQPGGAALAGARYAETHETAYGYPIAGMAGHSPPIVVGSAQLPIAGVVQSGSAVDDMLVVPLEVAQQAFGRRGEVSGFWVTARDPASVKPAVQRAAGAGAVVREVAGE